MTTQDEVLREFGGPWITDKGIDRTIDAMADEIVRLRSQLAAVTRLRDKALADAQGVVNVLGFFASCIKSGEQWTPQCDDMLHAAFAHRNKK